MERGGRNSNKLRAIMELLIEGKRLPADYKDHPLRGEFTGSRDCHVEPDRVLIYTNDGNHIRFERTGTHSDLFR
jgi:mRNA interferase YafQ